MITRKSAAVRAARLVQRVPLHWARAVEAPLVRSRATGRPSLLFLLALPRSGSTLTYQVLVHALRPLYLSNLWNLMYALPWLGGRLSRCHCADHESDFRSSHGFVGGMCGPAEGLRFWSYWTGCGLDETASEEVTKDALADRINYFRDVVRSLATPAEPLVAGYLGHALISKQLRYWFPEAVFLRLHRDPLSNAASILRTRKAGSGGWFSVLPAECNTVKGLGAHAEVASQVYWLNRRLEWLERDEQTIHLTYEELASSPNQVLARIIEGGNACGLAMSAQKPLPPRFEHQVVLPDEDADSARLWKELQRLQVEYGALAQPPPH
jgi:hypothetical protein